MIHAILCISTGSSDVHPFVHLILRNVCSVSALIFDFGNCCKNRVRWTHLISHHPLSCIDVIDMDWKKESWKYNKETTNSPRLSPILDCQFFSWGWFATEPFLIFLKIILTRWRISLRQYCCFSDRLHRLYLVGRPYLCKSSALALILSAPICPVHWSIFWNLICQIFVTVIMDIWGLKIDVHIIYS